MSPGAVCEEGGGPRPPAPAAPAILECVPKYEKNAHAHDTPNSRGLSLAGGHEDKVAAATTHCHRGSNLLLFI